MKNELIIASDRGLPRRRPSVRLQELLHTLGLEELSGRFFAGEPHEADEGNDATAATHSDAPHVP